MSDTCVEVNFPFGIMMSGSAQQPSISNDPLRGLMINLHGVLAAFSPVMKIAEFGKAVVDALNAIPDCITSLSPKKLLDRLSDVAVKLNALLTLLPAAAVPPMLRDIVSVLVLYLAGVRGMLQAVRASVNLSAGLSTTADGLDLAGDALAAAELRQIVQSSLQDSGSALASISAQSCPYNHLATTLQSVAGLVHLPSPPPIPSLSPDGGSYSTPQALLDQLDVAIGSLEQALRALQIAQRALGVSAWGGSASAALAG